VVLHLTVVATSQSPMLLDDVKVACRCFRWKEAGPPCGIQMLSCQYLQQLLGTVLLSTQALSS
jgi:hypothetical protein